MRMTSMWTVENRCVTHVSRQRSHLFTGSEAYEETQV